MIGVNIIINLNDLKIINNMLNNQQFRSFFPALAKQNIVYANSAQTSLRPEILISSHQDFLRHEFEIQHNDNYPQKLRNLIAKTFNLTELAGDNFATDNVIFTHNTTDSISKLALGLSHIFNVGDEIILSQLEHHANLVPWLNLAKKLKLNVKFAQVINAKIDCDHLISLLSPKTKLISFSACSNFDGTRQDCVKIVSEIKQKSTAVIHIDAAQAVAGLDFDMAKIDADLYSFSAHKLYGDTGLGFLCGKKQALSLIEPIILGGSMVTSVDFDDFSLQQLPYNLEAGTKNNSAIYSFYHTLTWLRQIDYAKISQNSQKLTAVLAQKLAKIPEIRLFSGANSTIISLTFTNNISCYDVYDYLLSKNIYSRIGKHCIHPYLNSMQLNETLRISLAGFNTTDDIEKIYNTILEALEIFC